MPRINPNQSKPMGDDLVQQQPPKAANVAVGAGFNSRQQGNAGNFPEMAQKDSRQPKPSSRGSGLAAEDTSEPGKGNMGVGEAGARRGQQGLFRSQRYAAMPADGQKAPPVASIWEVAKMFNRNADLVTEQQAKQAEKSDKSSNPEKPTEQSQGVQPEAGVEKKELTPAAAAKARRVEDDVSIDMGVFAAEEDNDDQQKSKGQNSFAHWAHVTTIVLVVGLLFVLAALGYALLMLFHKEHTE